MPTPEFHFDRSRRQAAMATPFVASWLDQASPGELLDPDLRSRTRAWAHWAAESIVGVTGTREYVALVLPGRFYDPQARNVPSARPHLEIPSSTLSAPAPEFPTRLALMGNGLQFDWWLYSEVVAAKRALFTHASGSIIPVAEMLTARIEGLRAGLELFRKAAAPIWDVVEEALVTSVDGLSALVTTPFETAEIDSYCHGAAALGLRLAYEEKLAERNGSWAARRMGVWVLSGSSAEGPFSFGVVTPRLTRKSTFMDPLFAPGTESPAALLVRALVLRRLAREVLSVPPEVLAYRVGQPAPVPTLSQPATPKAFLRGVPAQRDGKTPEASVAAAVAFIQSRTVDEAWEMLSSWAGSEYLLVVSEDRFRDAWRRAAAAVRRAETPDRNDINSILPLAWDPSGRVLRVTFVRG